jgi:hypothetical protein
MISKITYYTVGFIAGTAFGLIASRFLGAI